LEAGETGQEIMAEGLGNITRFEARPNLRIVEHRDVPLRERGDEALMLEHARGSEEAFEELVRRHQRGVLNYTYRMVQNRQIAEELTQEVFVALVKNAQRYEPMAKFTTYLYAIASNIVSKEWLRRKRRPTLFSLSSWTRRKTNDEEFDPLEHVRDEKANVLLDFEHGEISEAVTDALKHLPEHQREAFVLRRFQDMSYEDIAAVTNTPIGTVKSRVVRAERALRPLLARFREYI
jgi:RNA polymerase sigma-70 factor (ECF subfamily)